VKSPRPGVQCEILKTTPWSLVTCLLLLLLFARLRAFLKGSRGPKLCESDKPADKVSRAFLHVHATLVYNSSTFLRQ